MSETRLPTMNSDSSSTSNSLLSQVRRNDAQAWQRLVDLYTPLVCYWCGRANLDPQDADEVAQETFKAVHSNIAKFRHERPGDTFRGWLRTITANKIRDLLRKSRRAPDALGGSEGLRRIAELPAVVDDDERSAVQSLYERALLLIQKKFEPRTWQAFLLVVVEDQSPMVVAERLEMTPGAVRTARWRVLQELRLQLGEEE